MAAEGGASFYLPGINGPMAGFLPPEGVYFDNSTYFYDGSLRGGRQTLIGGNVAIDVKADIWANFATGIWVTPLEVLGGNFAVSATLPFGQPTVSAGGILNGPLINQVVGRPIAVSARDSILNIGDPVFTSMIGWHSGNWHWKVAAAVSIPAGAYQPGQLSNLALNRWVGDFSAGLTYFDPSTGWDLSTVAGFTVNGMNPATDYRTGNEFHIDGAITKNLTKELSVGAIVSHYQQLTGDSGSGARVGSFKGRTTAVGGTISYTFPLGQVPVTTRVKVLREVDVVNRARGTIGWLQISLPLWVPQAPKAPQVVSARY
ncbi:SphA family protein [Enterovirga rhinocerotis]|nr:transporter [Enterovirga rhinocerotis]